MIDGLLNFIDRYLPQRYGSFGVGGEAFAASIFEAVRSGEMPKAVNELRRVPRFRRKRLLEEVLAPAAAAGGLSEASLRLLLESAYGRSVQHRLRAVRA